MSVRNTVKSIQDIMRQDVGVDGDAQRISQLCWMFFLKIIDDQDQELELTKDEYRSPIPKKLQWRTWAADTEGITGDELLAFVNDDLFPALKDLATSTRPGERRRVVKNVFEDAYNYMKSGQLMRQVVNKINEIDFNNLTERQHFGDIYEQILNDLQSAGNAGEYYTPRAVTAFMADRIDPRPGEVLLDPACGTGGFLTCALSHMRKRYVKKPEDEATMQAALRAVEKKQLPQALCDQLEKARSEREATRDRLTTAGLARLNAPNPETFQDDARFALDALPAMTARADQIKQLRQTILNLAVRGKLVPQDPVDEPASELLRRMHHDRMHKRKLAQINEDDLEIPLPSAPQGWVWTTTDQIAADEDNAITDGPFGSQLKTSHYIGTPGFRVIRLQNIGSGIFRDEHRSYIDKGRFERLAKHHVKAGDLVVAGLVDPRVRCCEVPKNIGPTLVKADCYRFAVHPYLASRFALHYLNSPFAQEFAAVHHHGMTLTRIGLGNFRHIPMPLPPLAEQKRIVAKIDELLILGDRLEASLVAGEDARSRLLDALLHEALEPVPEDETAASKVAA
jgi:hypothetical protein